MCGALGILPLIYHSHRPSLSPFFIVENNVSQSLRSLQNSIRPQLLQIQVFYRGWRLAWMSERSFCPRSSSRARGLAPADRIHETGSR